MKSSRFHVVCLSRCLIPDQAPFLPDGESQREAPSARASHQKRRGRTTGSARTAAHAETCSRAKGLEKKMEIGERERERERESERERERVSVRAKRGSSLRSKYQSSSEIEEKSPVLAVFHHSPGVCGTQPSSFPSPPTQKPRLVGLTRRGKFQISCFSCKKPPPPKSPTARSSHEAGLID